MASEIWLAILIGTLTGLGLVAIVNVLSFFSAVPKQLKRIADALEKEKEDGK